MGGESSGASESAPQSESTIESETNGKGETDGASETGSESENPYIDAIIDPSLIEADIGANGEIELIVDNDEMCGNLVIPSKIGEITVTSVSGFSFKVCKNLISVSLPETVVKIDWYAFYICRELRTITLYPSVTFIGKRAFDDCPRIERIIFKGTKKQWNAIEKGDRWIDKTAKYVVQCTDGTIDNR